MFNETLYLISLKDLKDFFINEISILEIAITYVLLYVIYKVLGRYVYFKPQEHSSKINRTFLAISLLVILLSSLTNVTKYLPILPEYKWIFSLGVLVLLIALFSILTNIIFLRYKHNGYIPISNDYYRTNIYKRDESGGHGWEEEGVRSTDENLHSDIMLNILSLIIFVFITVKWALFSMIHFGFYSILFFIPLILWFISIFIDRGIFSWISYLMSKNN
jgi:hypothetical protein